MSASYIFETVHLAEEVSAPHTGEWQNTAKLREVLYFIKHSGANGWARIEVKSPFGDEVGLPVHSGSFTGNGYADAVFAQSPFDQVRFVCGGSGIYSAAVMGQN